MRMRLFSLTLCIVLVMCLGGCRNKDDSLNRTTVTEGRIQIIDETKNAKTDDTEDVREDEEEISEHAPEEAESIQNGEDDFYIKEIDDVILARMRGKSYKDDCPIPIEDLRYIHILHKDIAGKTLEGELVVNAHIAEDVLEIFKELYEVSYPIEKVRLVDEYGGDDELSMEDNNSSAFNYRSMVGSTKISKHGLGMAIDINTLYNPYVKETAEGTVTEPVTATEYVNREGEFDYKINKDDEAYRIFTEHGFEWGGNWKSVKDYQHFEVPTDVIRSIYAWY